jgi:PPM family protein phosphatase
MVNGARGKKKSAAPSSESDKARQNGFEGSGVEPDTINSSNGHIPPVPEKSVRSSAVASDAAVVEASTQTLPQITHSANTDPGVGIEENEDAYSASETESFKMFMLADGMGGGTHGRDVALGILSSIRFLLNQYSDLNTDVIKLALEGANEEVLKKVRELKFAVRIGATLIGAVFTSSNAIVFGVGNSRFYRIRAGAINQLSIDHTVEGQLRRGRGEKRPLQAGSRPSGHLLTSAFGLSNDIEMHISVFPEVPEAGDLYLMCTDGLYDVLTEETIVSFVGNEGPLKRTVRRLVAQARSEGSTDNITALLMQIESVPTDYLSLSQRVPGIVVSEGVLKVANNDDDTDIDEDFLLLEEENEVALSSQNPSYQEALNKEEAARQGRAMLAGRADQPKNISYAEPERITSEQGDKLEEAFNKNTFKRGVVPRHTRGRDPFASVSANNRGKGQGSIIEKSLRVPKNLLQSSSYPVVQFMVITLVAVAGALLAAGLIASQFRLDDHLKGRETVVNRGSRESSFSTETSNVGNENASTRREAKRLLDLAQKVKNSSNKYQFKDLLENESTLSFDKIKNVEMRNLMLNVYSAIQVAVSEGEKQIDEIAEHSSRLSESVARLSLEIDKLEKNQHDKMKSLESVPTEPG